MCHFHNFVTHYYMHNGFYCIATESSAWFSGALTLIKLLLLTDPKTTLITLVERTLWAKELGQGLYFLFTVL